MSKIRPDKVATVDEVKSKVAGTSTAVVTEYRGLTVAQISALRRQLRTLGADYKVFKNTLVLRAITGTAVEPIGEFLQGPTAIAFVDGDVFGLQDEHAAVGHGVAGVDHQVEHHLGQLARVGFDAAGPR